MRSLASGGLVARLGMAMAVSLALSAVAGAAESAKSVDEVLAASKKSGKAILTLLGSET